MQSFRPVSASSSIPRRGAGELSSPLMTDPEDPGAKLDGAAAFDIPDLDLDVPSPQRPAAAPRPSAKPSRESAAVDLGETDFERGSSVSPGRADPMSAYSGGALDLDGEDGGGGSIDLQSYRPPGADPAVMPALPEMPAAPRPPSAAAAPHHAPVHGQAELAQAREHAGYGPVPGAIYLLPLYSWKVFKRRRELRVALAELNLEVDRAELRRDEAFANVTNAARAEYEGDSRFESGFATVRLLEEQAGARGDALSQLSAQAQATTSQLAAQITALQAQLEQHRGQAQTAAQEVARRQDALGRVVARQKRFLIEARSAQQVAQQAAGGQPGAPIAPEHAQKIEELQAQAAALQPEANGLQQELATAEQALAGIKSQIAGASQQIRALEQQQQGVERQFQGQISAQQADFSSVQRELTRALADVGRLFLMEKETVRVEPPLRQAVAHAHAELQRITTQRDLALTALDAHDPEAFKKGILVAAGAVGGMILLLIVLIAVL